MTHDRLEAELRRANALLKIAKAKAAAELAPYAREIGMDPHEFAELALLSQGGDPQEYDRRLRAASMRLQTKTNRPRP
jgi:hypothetical protein